MDAVEKKTLESLLGKDILDIWKCLVDSVDRLYDMDKIWNKGFGDWIYEYKYRRGGKTLCTFYAKQDVANILIILGKAEREKFEMIRETFSKQILTLYDSTSTYHDGKWLWIPLDEKLIFDDVLMILKMKRRPNRK